MMFAAALSLNMMITIHSWYPMSCCGGKDCFPVPCDDIKAANGGWKWQGVFFPRDRFHVSQDENCHVCVLKDVVPSGICVFLRPET